MNRLASRCAGAVAVCVLAAACGAGGSGHRGGTVPGATAGSMPASATPAGNRARAEREAQRLLGLTPVPPGAVAVGRLAALPFPAVGRPNADSVIDETRSWRVGMSADRTLAWVRAHLPTGLSAFGSVSASGGGAKPMSGYSYKEPDSDAWVQAQLQVGVAALGPGSSGLRADAILLWLDPRPQRDEAEGARMRVTLAGGCPPSDRGAGSVANTGPDLDRALLPATDPTSGLVCRYAGITTNRLAARRRLDAAAARRLASIVRQVRLSHVEGGTTSCGMDDGSATVLAFAYPGRPDVDLWYAPYGCSSISNGHIRAGAIGVAAALNSATR